MSYIKNSQSRVNSYVQNPLENAECLIIQDTKGEDIALIPIGVIDGSILYIESRDLPPHEVGMQEPNRHLGA